MAQPVLFLSHGGGPCFFLDGSVVPMMKEIDTHSETASFFRNLPEIIKSPNVPEPSAIIVVSAHWEGYSFAVSCPESTDLNYDYGGFPKEGYAPYLTWEGKSDAKLGKKVLKKLQAYAESTGTFEVHDKLCTKSGFDHGVFIPLKLAYPDASKCPPVIQISLQEQLQLSKHYSLGEALAPMRRVGGEFDNGCLIIGSGQISHNMGLIKKLGIMDYPHEDKQTKAFIQWVYNALIEVCPENREACKDLILRAAADGPFYHHVHPRAEHFVPMSVALGAALALDKESKGKWKRIHDRFVMGCFGLDSYIWRE